MLVAGAAAALLMSASPAHAGVKFEKVQTKKVSPATHGILHIAACQPANNCISTTVVRLAQRCYSQSTFYKKTVYMQMFQGSGAPAAVKVPQLPEVKKPGEPIKLPSFGIDAGSIALPGKAIHMFEEHLSMTKFVV